MKTEKAFKSCYVVKLSGLSGNGNYKYFLNLDEAKSYANYNGGVLLKKCTRVYCVHTALAKGYVIKTGGCYSESYTGRYGEGVKVHYPNCQRNMSNRFHVVEYWCVNNNN